MDIDIDCYSLILGGIIQEILPRPLLFFRKRFSIRMHAVVTSDEPFTGLFSANSFVVLAAGEDAETGTTDAAFITNVHYNTGILNGVNQGTLLQYFEDNGLLSLWLEKTIPAMGLGFHEFLSKEYKIPSEPDIKRFELYGCDILLDEDMNPWLLECNRCAGVRKFIKNRTVLYNELLYILLHSYFVGHDIPHLQYWTPFIQYKN